MTWRDTSGHWSAGLRLDYGFGTPGLAGKIERAWIDDDANGSDHQPMWFELDMR